MIMKSLEVVGFLGRAVPLRMAFNADLNIITGYNGAGKTNLLKLIWYTLSGNITTLLREVTFSEVIIETDEYHIHIIKQSEQTCRGLFVRNGDTYAVQDIYDEDNDIIIDARDKFSEYLKDIGSSIFFPTFRRIEGGFTISSTRSKSTNHLSLFNMSQGKSDVEEAVHAVSRRLSNNDHTFVTSVSTMDISELLLKRYSEMSEKGALAQSRMSKDVERKIREFRAESAKLGKDQVTGEAVRVLDGISRLIEQADSARESALAPLRAVQKLAAKIFKHKGIQINRGISLGDAANAISSDLLSAGEKQMLSFICYNAFIDNSMIFIDEPELSLHVDWQRTLFPTLESQRKSNQFIIATHSPFIYSKYPEKEITLSQYRGDEIV